MVNKLLRLFIWLRTIFYLIVLLTFYGLCIYFLIFGPQDYFAIEITDSSFSKFYEWVSNSAITKMTGTISLDKFCVLVIMLTITVILFLSYFFSKTLLNWMLVLTGGSLTACLSSFWTGKDVYLNFLFFFKVVKKYTFGEKLNIFSDVMNQCHIHVKISFANDVYPWISNLNGHEAIKDQIYRTIIALVTRQEAEISGGTSIGNFFYYIGDAVCIFAQEHPVIFAFTVTSFFLAVSASLATLALGGFGAAANGANVANVAGAAAAANDPNLLDVPNPPGAGELWYIFFIALHATLLTMISDQQKSLSAVSEKRFEQPPSPEAEERIKKLLDNKKADDDIGPDDPD